MPTASYCGRLRGDFLNLTALLCGSRFGRGWSGRAGSRSTPSAEAIAELKQRLAEAERDVRNAVDLLWKSSSVQARFEDTGVLTREAAADLGMVGPAARACGIERDGRHDFPAPVYPRPPACRSRSARPAMSSPARDAALARDRELRRRF